MIHGVPWGVVSTEPLREGLVTLSDRMDLDVSGERASRAYVALRMIVTRVQRARNFDDLQINLSLEASTALAQELATMPNLAGLREVLLHTLQTEKEERANENQRVKRPHRATVRESRAFRFQR